MARRAPPDARPRPLFAVLCNPRSGEIRKRLKVTRAAGRHLAGPLYREASRSAEIRRELLALTADPRRPLCILGGDGTVQAVLTALLEEEGDPRRWPPLAVLPGGSTNMIARDLGFSGSLEDELESLRLWSRADPVGGGLVRRPVLRLERREGETLCGTFFGAGAVATGVRYWSERLKGRGPGRVHTAPLAIARILLSLTVGRAPAELVPSLEYAVDGEPVRFREALLCLVTTLDRLILGTRPHWGEGPGSLRFTLVERDPGRLWLNLPRLARGRPGKALTPERGYHSRKATRLRMSFTGHFVLDGELFHHDATDGPLRITALEGARWLVPE